MRTDVLPALAVGTIAAVVTFLLDPSPSWWLVGLMTAAVLIVNPRRPR
jgi:hypothetical protein